MKITKHGFMFSIDNLTKDNLADLIFVLEDACDANDDVKNYIGKDFYNKLLAEINRQKIFGE